MQSKFLILTTDLKKLWLFYSALGIRWLCGESEIKDMSSLETKAPMGLPDLNGEIGGVEFFFCLEPNIKTGPINDTILLLYFDSESAVAATLTRIKEAGLFVPHQDFNAEYLFRILDPDGRIIQLVGPSPFRW